MAYTVVVTGTNGTVEHVATALLTVIPHPDLAIDIQPPSQQVAQGQSVD